MNRTRHEILTYFLILLGSILYAVGTVFFIFPHSLLLGGTSGISVILEAFLPFSPGTILMIINCSLIVLAFFVLGRDMAVKSFVGSAMTTLSVGGLEMLWDNSPVVANPYVSAVCGALIIALASGVMFYVGSSSGGTDIVALIVKKYTKINDIGKALLVTDVLIVVIGGVLSGWTIAISSFIGLLIKTGGIDLVIGIIRKKTTKK